MKRNLTNYWLVLSLLVVLFSCSDEPIFEPFLTTNLETTELNFTKLGGTQEFELESNEIWSIGTVPEWIFVKVEDVASATRSTTYVEGIKKILITVSPNTGQEARKAEILFSSASGKTVKLVIEQDKTAKLIGYWILSEGYGNSNTSELAWYDVETGELSVKQFKTRNEKELGDTGNDLKIYGSKMYCVVTGPGFGATATEGTNYIEVINPANGKSIKRIPFTDASGKPAKPRNIIFAGGKGYVSSYSNEVVRIDTATLALDAHATLSGTLSEGLAVSNGNIYVCNSGQGADNKISVVDMETMKETKVITTANNPTGIVAVGSDKLYFNTNYPDYNVYEMKIADTSISQVEGLKASNITYSNGLVYSNNFDWNTYEGALNFLDPATNKVSKLLLDMESVGIRMMMEYKIGKINGSNDLFLTGMGDDVIIIDPETKSIKQAFKTKIPNSSGVVAYYN